MEEDVRYAFMLGGDSVSYRFMPFIIMFNTKTAMTQRKEPENA